MLVDVAHKHQDITSRSVECVLYTVYCLYIQSNKPKWKTEMEMARQTVTRQIQSVFSI